MSKVFIEESTLTAIGDAIREKTGVAELISPLNMATEIKGIETGGGELPEEAFTITGDCSYRFASGGWDWFIDNYKDNITFTKIANANHMFSNSKLETIPSINFEQTNYYTVNNMFASCRNLKEIGTLKNLYPADMQSMFQGCIRLRCLPQFENLNLNRIYTYASINCTNFLNGCSSLRSIPEDFLKQLYNPLSNSYFYAFLHYSFYSCYALDEIRGLNPRTGTMTGNMFSYTFLGCNRLNDIIFATQEDGTPYSVNWKSQTIELSSSGSPIGWGSLSYVTNYNSGITADKEVRDDATYQALKNDPDWFATKVEYSRYNHDSAVNTINSLPDTSAYLATAGGTNTIKFRGAAGSATDGGAINTLTEEEIAVAAAKGWTVTIV